MKRNRKGFTIVELVIVIAIIAILAAVLIPTFSNLIKKANEANAQAEAKNIVSEMLVNILTGENGDADLLVISQKGNDVYVYGYSKEAGRVIAYHDTKSLPAGKTLEEYVTDELLKSMIDDGALTEVKDLAEDDWRQPANTQEIVKQLDAKGASMMVYANYKIAVDCFLNANSFSVNGVPCDSFSDAVLAASDGGTITICRSTSEPLVVKLDKDTTLKNITFKVGEGVTVKGMQLVGEKDGRKVKYKLTLQNITFEGINFTDQVVLGQGDSTYGLSECSNITFENCKFDLSGSKERYPDAIKRGAASVSGTISEKEQVAYLDGLTIKNCTFQNVRYGVFGGKARNVTIEGCKFANCDSYAVRFEDVAGKFELTNNEADKTAGFLTINTVGNNYSTTKIETNITITNNTATNMDCGNGDVFMTAYDNARASGKSSYTITGNTVDYKPGKVGDGVTKLIGFRIKTTYGPSKAEFIENK